MTNLRGSRLNYPTADKNSLKKTFDATAMFKMMVLQLLYNLSDDSD